MGSMKSPFHKQRQNLIAKFASRLRYPQLFMVVASIFVVDLMVPDVIPFADEILLGLLTFLIGSLRDRADNVRQAHEPRVVKNVTPDEEL